MECDGIYGILWWYVVRHVDTQWYQCHFDSKNHAASIKSSSLQSIGFFGPGIALIGLTTARNPFLASAWLTIAVGLKSFSHSGFLVNLQEIAPRYSGVLHGISNTAGTLAAIVGTVGAGFFVELVGSFRGFLLLTSLLYFLAALFYNIFSTGERVNFDETGP